MRSCASIPPSLTTDWKVARSANSRHAPFPKPETSRYRSTATWTSVAIGVVALCECFPPVRWTSPDPYLGSYNLAGQPADPEPVCVRGQLGNNPLAFTDPSGLEMCLGCGMGPGDGGDDCDIYGLLCGCDPIFGDCGGDVGVPGGPPPHPAL